MARSLVVTSVPRGKRWTFRQGPPTSAHDSAPHERFVLTANEEYSPQQDSVSRRVAEVHDRTSPQLPLAHAVSVLSLLVA